MTLRGVLTLARLAAAAWIAPRVIRSALVRRSSAGAVMSTMARSDTDRCDVSVVVPARDEVTRLGPLLTALGDRHEVIVVDDGSADGTADLARSFGARVVTVGARPAGWVGKTWALRCGAQAATSQWVVHLDADVRPDPRLPSALVAHAECHRLDLLTAGTRAVAPTWAARWLHAAMLATLVYRFGGPGADSTGRELANGQVLVARRSLLCGPHGWKAVASHVTEDVALVRLLAASGHRVAMAEGFDLVSIEVASFTEAWRGWGRSIGLPGVEPRWRIAVDAAALALTMPIPLLRLLSRRADALDLALVAMRVGTAVGLTPAYRPAGLAVWMAPAADPAAIVAVALAAVRRSVNWRGRRLPVPR
ncbi:MAG: glycosyl transferase group 2 family protein [Acidimicrobiaceae bacterium]|nr:glycosyl transferase group 2 family protein [Acidimicrobiaceae bacterium]